MLIPSAAGKSAADKSRLSSTPAPMCYVDAGVRISTTTLTSKHPFNVPHPEISLSSETQRDSSMYSDTLRLHPVRVANYN